MSRRFSTLLMLLLASSALSTPLINRENLGGGQRTNFAGTLGLGFIMGPENRVVDSLGMLDIDEDGLVNEHPAGLWDSAGTLLGQAVIPAGTEAELIDGYRWASIEEGPVTLIAGQKYYLGVLMKSGGDPFTDTNPVALDPYYVGDSGTWHLGWAGGDTLTRTQADSPGGWANQVSYGSYNMANLGGAKVVKASLVAPQNAAVIGDAAPTLEWKSGELSLSNNVYLGNDEEAIANATPDSPEFVINQPGSTFTLTEPLMRGVTYYWRVDGVNESEPNSPWKGDVWSFFVQPLKAYDLKPVDGTDFVPTTTEVTWKAGANTLLHQIYFGTDKDEVENGANAPLLPLTPTSFTMENLANDTTYYWRVDQFTQTGVIKGDILSFKTVPMYPVVDETLLGWWTLDEMNPGSAVDHSGHALHGVIVGTPETVDGALGSAWALDGASYAETPAPVDVNTNTMTFCGWVKPDSAGAWDGMIFSRSASNTAGLSINGNKEAAYHWAGQKWQYRSGLHVRNGEWSFVALVIEPDKATLVVNDTNSVNEGVDVEHPARPIESGFMLGGDAPNRPGRHMNGSLDDLRVYTRALSLVELKQVMQVSPPAPAEPNPLTVENFDGYAAYDSEALLYVWEIWSDGYGGNGTGSQVGNTNVPYMELSAPYAGVCAVPLQYLNNGAAFNPDGSFSKTYSEISRVFDPAQDLTRGEAMSLKLWMKGNAGNEVQETDQLYITLGDGVKSKTIILAEASDLKKNNWSELTVDLAGLGINLKAVTELAIGVGDPQNPQVGGIGVVLIDEIMLSTTLE